MTDMKCNICGKPFRKRVPSPTCDACREKRAADGLAAKFQRRGKRKNPISKIVTMKFEVVEAARLFHYHLRERGCEKSVCGKLGMRQSEIPFTEWHVTKHEAVEWCPECNSIAKINGWLDEVDLT